MKYYITLILSFIGSFNVFANAHNLKEVTILDKSIKKYKYSKFIMNESEIENLKSIINEFNNNEYIELQIKDIDDIKVGSQDDMV